MGTNVIAAVGPLVTPGENHIFVSQQTINELLDSVEITLDKFDTNILTIKQEMLLKLDLIKDELSDKSENNVLEIQEKINAVLTEAKQYTDDITFNKINEIQTLINDIQESVLAEAK